MNIQAIDRFVAGADEIERKRKVISRIFSAVIWKLLGVEKTLGIKNKMLFDVILENDEILYVYREGIFRIRLSVGRVAYMNDKLIYEVLTTGGVSQSECPLNLVHVVYNALPKFVASAHNAVPEAGILEYFDEIIAHAPTAS